MRPRLLIPLACVALLIGAVVFAPSGGDTLWIKTLHNLAHAPIFGAIALAALFALRSFPALSSRPAWQHYAFAFGIAAFLGLATEIAQVPSGRDASWMDLVNDLLGAAAFLALYYACDRRAARRSWAAKTISVITGVIALLLTAWPLASTAIAYARRANGFPAIADFTRGIGPGFITTRFARIDIEPIPERWSSRAGRALRIDFFPGSWPGITFSEPPPDWRSYDILYVDVINPTPVELAFTIRIDDREHNGRYADRYNRVFRVPPETRTAFSIPLTDIRSAPRDRELDLSQVKRILVFRFETSKAESMYLVGMALKNSIVTK